LLHAQADVVILDAGSGMSPWVQQLWKSAQQILLVSTDEPVAMMDSYAAVKLSPWGDVDGKVRLVINQCNDSQAAKILGGRFEATCRRFLGINVAPAVALTTHPDILTTVTRPNEHQADRDFRQSIRLLAADVMSTSLALVGKRTSVGNALRGVPDPRHTASTPLPGTPRRAVPTEQKNTLPEKSLQNTK